MCIRDRMTSGGCVGQRGISFSNTGDKSTTLQAETASRIVYRISDITIPPFYSTNYTLCVVEKNPIFFEFFQIILIYYNIPYFFFSMESLS